MPRGEDLEAAILEHHAQYLINQPTTMRRCLSCDYWMRSALHDRSHRRCNWCKGEQTSTGKPRVGDRVLESVPA